jgi:hypothetical protein
MAGHHHPQPPRMRSPLEPPTGPLRTPAPQEPPTGLLRSPAPREPPAAPLPLSATAPRRSKPQERPPVGVGSPKCPVNKNNDKIYQMKQ